MRRDPQLRGGWLRLPAAVPLALLLLSGCGAMDAGFGPTQDGGSAADGSYSDAGMSFTLSVLSSATPVVGESVLLQAVVSGGAASVDSYDWDVRDPEGTSIESDVVDSKDLFRFTPQMAGTYSMSCTVTLSDGESRFYSASLVVDDGGQKLTYTARIIPDPSSGLPPKDVVLDVGATGQQSLNWQLETGKEVRLSVTDANSAAVPSTVRLFRIDQTLDPVPREIYLPGGSGTFHVTGGFHALLLPQAPDLPPLLQAGQNAASMSSSWPVQLDAGLPVSGTVSRNDGSPMVGGTVTLHTRFNNILVPSTLSSTDSNGAFTVRTRQGPARLTVVPPPGEGLPVAMVEGAELEVSGAAQGWSFHFAAPSQVSLSGTVSTSDGSGPATDASVVLMATSLPAQVGTLTLGATDLPASGLSRLALTTDSQGTLRDPATGATSFVLPRALYQVEVWPGANEAAQEGYFLKTVDLTQSASMTLPLQLGERVQLRGRVQDQSGAPLSARVVASAATGSFSTQTDKAGEFQLYLNDQASYSLVVRSTSKNVSTYINPSLSVQGSTVLAPIKLPPAVLLSGKLTTSGNLGIAGAMIRIWCSGQNCPSNAVVDEVQVHKDGRFELRVPPPPEPEQP